MPSRFIGGTHFDAATAARTGRPRLPRGLVSLDHLLPKGHPDRDKPEYIVTACMFCNTADNHYFLHAEKRRIVFDGKTPEELVEQRRPYVEATRQKYEQFWRESVHPK